MRFNRSLEDKRKLSEDKERVLQENKKLKEEVEKLREALSGPYSMGMNQPPHVPTSPKAELKEESSDTKDFAENG